MMNILPCSCCKGSSCSLRGTTGRRCRTFRVVGRGAPRPTRPPSRGERRRRAAFSSEEKLVLPTGGIHSYKFSKIQIEEKKKERGRRGGGVCVGRGDLLFSEDGRETVSQRWDRKMFWFLANINLNDNATICVKYIQSHTRSMLASS